MLMLVKMVPHTRGKNFMLLCGYGRLNVFGGGWQAAGGGMKWVTWKRYGWLAS